MSIEVRAATADDVPSLIGAYEWLFAPPGSRPPSWNEQRAVVALREAIESRDSMVLVAEDDGGLRGFITGYFDMHSVRFGHRVWVEDLAVDPERRSAGIGKRLLDEMKGWASERGASHLELDSADNRHDAHRFYEREGPSWRSVCFAWEL